MSAYDDMRQELAELIKLVRADEQYLAAVAGGAVQADRETQRVHSQRALRIEALMRRYEIPRS